MTRRTKTDAAKTGMGVYIALLRGINVAGKNKLPMKDLAAMFADLGCRDVQTYIQSGNVVFRASRAVAKRIAGMVGETITETFGFRAPVVLRSADELGEVVSNNPYLRRGIDPAVLHVAFLADVPAAAAVSNLDPARSPPDAFALIGREIYLRCPHGLGRSKLTNDYFDRKLSTTSTIRNWRTVLELEKLARTAFETR